MPASFKQTSVLLEIYISCISFQKFLIYIYFSSRTRRGIRSGLRSGLCKHVIPRRFKKRRFKRWAAVMAVLLSTWQEKKKAGKKNTSPPEPPHSRSSQSDSCPGLTDSSIPDLSGMKVFFFFSSH